MAHRLQTQKQIIPLSFQTKTPAQEIWNGRHKIAADFLAADRQGGRAPAGAAQHRRSL